MTPKLRLARIAAACSASELPTVAALVILGFALTLAVTWERHPSGLSVSWTGPMLAARFSQLVAASAPAGTPAARAATPDAPKGAPAPLTPMALPDAPEADATGPPLPMLLAFSSHPAPADDDEESAVARGFRRPTVRQLDLLNNAGKPLQLTVVAVNVSTQEATRVELFLPPRGQAHLGAESGLVLEPGYQVTIHSRGYHPLESTAP